MKTKDCSHQLRGSQAVNYITEGSLCLLPLEMLTCLSCGQEHLLYPPKQMIVPHPSSGSKRLLEQLKAEADKARKGESIIKPAEPSIIT